MYLHSFYMYGSFLCLHVCITHLHCLNGPEECIQFSETWVTDASEPLDGCLELKLGTLNALNCLALSPDPYGMFLTTSSVGNQEEWLLALLSLRCPQASLNNSCREVAHSWHWKFHLLTYGIWESLCLPIWSTCIQILIFFLFWLFCQVSDFFTAFSIHLETGSSPHLCSLPFPWRAPDSNIYCLIILSSTFLDLYSTLSITQGTR